MVRQDGTLTRTIGETADLLLGTFFPSKTEPANSSVKAR